MTNEAENPNDKDGGRGIEFIQFVEFVGFVEFGETRDS